MLKVFFIFFLAFVSFCLKAQNFQKVYSAVGSDRGHAIITTSDGGYAIAGLTSSFGAGGKDLFLIKTNSSGNIVWQKTFGSSNNEDGTSVALAQTPDGGFVITGSTYGFGSISGDCYVIKVDVNGVLVWSNKYSTNTDLEHGRGLKIASNGDVLLAGTDNSDNFGAADLLLMRLDSGGNRLWSKVYGGGSNDHLHSIEELPGGNLIISGSSSSYGPGGTAGYVIKTDPAGNVLWDYTYGGNNQDSFNASALTNNNQIVLTGPTNSYGAGNYDVFVTKIDTNGVVLWTKNYGGPGFERGASIKTIPNSNDYYIVANSESFGNGNKELLAIRIDSNGNVIWSKTFGTSLNEAFDLWSQHTMTPTSDGGFAMTGWSDSLSVGGSGDEILLIKSDALGTSLCNDAILSVSSPNITRNNPTSNVTNTGNYISVNSIQGNSSFTEGTLNYCSITVPPTADFTTPSTTICINDCIDFSDLSIVGTNVHYSWSFPGATPNNSNQQNPTNICYSAGGSYNVWLVVTDDFGTNTLSIPGYITVDSCTVPTANFAFPNSICVNDCIDFNDLSTSTTTDWNWDLQGGSPNNSTLQNPTGICFNSAGSFPITLTASNIHGSNDTTFYIDVIAPPSAGNDSAVVYCVTQADFSLIDLLTGADNNAGDWIETSSGQIVSPLISPQTIGAGLYEYDYAITNGFCSDMSHFIISIENVNNAGIGTIITFCQGAGSFNLFDSLSGNPDAGGIWSPNLNSGTGIYSPQNDSDGSYLYILSGNACANDTSEIITETIVLAAPILDVPNVVCSTIADFNLQANIQGGLWSGIGVVNSSTGLFSVNGLSFGDYAITYTVDSLGCQVNANDIISVTVPPYIEPIADFSWCYEDPLSLEVIATNGNGYNWSTGDTTAILSINFTDDDIESTYTYSIEVTNYCGTTQDEFSIYIDVCEIFIYVPNAFTPNADENNNTFKASLDGMPISKFKFDIYNRWGELIWQSLDSNVGWDATYNGKICQNGIYTWVIEFSTTKQSSQIYRGHVNLMR